MISRLAIVCSAHGFGHLTRQLAVAERLRALGVEPTIFTAAPRVVVEGTLPGARVVPWTADVGVAQADSVTEDVPRTRALLAERCADGRIDALARALSGFERVVVDTAPPALEAARRAGVEAVAVGNFDWAWIYGRYPALADWAERFAIWQAPHRAAQLWPGPGMRGFAEVRRFGLIGRRRPAVRLAPRAALVSFGGFGLADLDARLPRIDGLTWVLAPPMPPLERPDAVHAPPDVPYPALVAGADVVLTKPGYGIFAEAALAGTRLIWIPRGAFPEAPWLEEAMRARGDRQAKGDLTAALQARLADPAPPPVEADAVDALARWLVDLPD
ncbi:MAG: hypothetical protein H6739_16860 [Alphaproteobacteria bacterium]|nr:hypothetical protein [Alphaproteobacteria bacterium]